MRAVSIDIADQTPKLLEYETAESSDAIVTMGCGDACPVFPGKRYEDRKLEDSAGKGVDAVRPILTEAGLLDEQRGVWAYYRLVPSAIAAIADLLTPSRKRATKQAH